MFPRDYRRDPAVLCTLLAVSAAYCFVLLQWRSLTGYDLADGIVGMALGLYICSFPAANMIDILFYRDALGPGRASGWSGAGWVTLNVVALLVAWLMITTGVWRAAT